MTTASTLQHSDVTPLTNNTHEGSITIWWWLAEIVGETDQGSVEFKAGDFRTEGE